jgi:hypothetical protein
MVLGSALVDLRIAMHCNLSIDKLPGDNHINFAFLATACYMQPRNTKPKLWGVLCYVRSSFVSLSNGVVSRTLQ